MEDHHCLFNLQKFSISNEEQHDQHSDNERIIKIQNFCNKIAITLRANEIGYIRDWDLGLHVFEDNGIDPFKLSLELGFNSFEEFLRSEHMKNFIELDDTDGVTTYHYPMSEVDKRTSVHQEQAASFLELDKNRKIRMRNNVNSRDCPNADKILAKRYRKRFGIECAFAKEEEEREKRNNSKYAVGRGKQVYVSRSKQWTERKETSTPSNNSSLLSGLISSNSSISNGGGTSTRGRRRLSNREILYSL